MIITLVTAYFGARCKYNHTCVDEEKEDKRRFVVCELVRTREREI